MAASLAQAARRVEKGGADFVALCTNTMQRMTAAITQAVSMPLLHIADATAEELKERGIRNVDLLATRSMMEQDFCKGRLAREHGIAGREPTEGDLF